MIFSSFAVNALCNTVKQQLQDCISSTACTAGDKFHVRACCTCDRLLRPRDSEMVKVRTLVKQDWVKAPDSLHSDVKRYYQYNRCPSLKRRFPSLTKLLISPRAVYHERDPRCTVSARKVEPVFEICGICNVKVKERATKKEPCPPWWSISNFALGGAPSILTRLNDAELALVAQGRMN